MPKEVYYTPLSISSTISDKNYLETNLVTWKFYQNSWMVLFAEIISVAAYWKSGNTKTCAKQLSQILAENIDNGKGGLVPEFMWGIV